MIPSKSRALLWAVALLAALVLGFGCAGNVSGGSAGIHPTVTILWPARSRTVNAPSSAMSFQITLTPNNGSGGSPVTALFNRGNNSAAFTQTYTLPNDVAAGLYEVQVTFLPLENGQSNPYSSPVGTASGATMLTPTHADVGSYTMVGNVDGVEVIPNQTVPVGSTLALNAAAYTVTDSSLAVDLVVTPGSIFWNVVSTDGSMTVTPDGHITATAAGSITVTATVDGVVSSPTTVSSYAANPVSGCSNSTYLPNYASEMESSVNPIYTGKLRHWTSFPLSVNIVSNGNLTPACQSMAQQGMAAWTAATSGQATFTSVSASQSPDITITFKPSSSIAAGQDGVVGATTIYPSASDASVLSHVDVVVASDLADNAQTLDTVTHELGHALGIGGHSQADQDLMFPYLNDDFAPTSDDINTLYTAYCGSFPQSGRSARTVRPPRSTSPIVIVEAPGSK